MKGERTQYNITRDVVVTRLSRALDLYLRSREEQQKPGTTKLGIMDGSRYHLHYTYFSYEFFSFVPWSENTYYRGRFEVCVKMNRHNLHLRLGTMNPH